MSSDLLWGRSYIFNYPTTGIPNNFKLSDFITTSACKLIGEPFQHCTFGHDVHGCPHVRVNWWLYMAELGTSIARISVLLVLSPRQNVLSLPDYNVATYAWGCRSKRPLIPWVQPQGLGHVSVSINNKTNGGHLNIWTRAFLKIYRTQLSNPFFCCLTLLEAALQKTEWQGLWATHGLLGKKSNLTHYLFHCLHCFQIFKDCKAYRIVYKQTVVLSAECLLYLTNYIISSLIRKDWWSRLRRF